MECDKCNQEMELIMPEFGEWFYICVNENCTKLENYNSKPYYPNGRDLDYCLKEKGNEV